MTAFMVQPGGRLHGRVRLPGDKSISHRAIIFASLAEGASNISGFLEGDDCLSTIKAFRQMGVHIEGPVDGQVLVHGVGLHGLRAPEDVLDLGNSGTSMRLLLGLLAAQPFSCILQGDVSLNKRPMRRVMEPLQLMGARIDATNDGTPPLRIHTGAGLRGIHYRLPMASAQVKSALLLAGMYAIGDTCITEPTATRDHSERLLKAFAYPLRGSSPIVCIDGKGHLLATEIKVPADISAAAFFMVAAAITEGSDIVLVDVGTNPTRTGVIDILRLMGADIELMNESEVSGEAVADIRIRSAGLHGVNVPAELVPRAIDELPVLFVAAACATGKTVFTGAGELRVKESDRLQSMADGLQACGIVVQPTADGMVIHGGQFHGADIDSCYDHRISMSFAVAGLRASSAMHIRDCDHVNTSFPGFVQLISGAGMAIETVAA